MKAKGQVHHWRNFLKDIFWLFKPVWKKRSIVLGLLFFISTGIALVSLFQAYANGVLVNTIIDSVGHGVNKHAVSVSLILIGISLIVPGFLYILQNFLQKDVFFFLTKYFDLHVEQKRMELDVAQYENSAFSNFINRVNEKGVYTISNIITNSFYNYQSLITIIFSSLIIARQSFAVFFAIFLSVIPELIINTEYGKRGWYIWGDEVDAEERRKYYSIKDYIKMLPSFTEMKLFGLGIPFIGRIEKFLDHEEKKQVTNEKKLFTQGLFAMILSQGVLLATTIFFTREAILGEIQAGTVIFLFGGMIGFQNSVSALFTSLGRQQEDRLYIHDLSRFLKTKAEIIDGTEEIKLETSPEIHFKNVSFAYPNSQKKVYEGLSLTIAPGEKLAIVGLNGAGKTTLIKLLCRFYDPNSGEVLINGKNLRSIKRDSWYRSIGILFQDYAKFAFTSVGEMITFGDPVKAPDQKNIESSAERADAHFIAGWQKGYEQQLGKNFQDGVEPSGGQWQKLALARLFYRDPKVWILDEPTSAIDADAEAKIFESLAKLPKDKTVILISHRFSTVRTADRIIVIDEGKVRESGTHKELIKLDGEYARLFSLQAKGYK